MGRIGHILAVAMLAAGPAWAQWSTNWPSQEFPRALQAQIVDCWSGITERCVAAGVSAPSTNDMLGWRDARADLMDLKTCLKAAVSGYVDAGKSGSGTFNTYFAGGASDFPMWSVTGLCACVGVPTNYFEFTPYRGLSGVGAETNDATVDYPHGYTNAYTTAGGSWFPGSRTNWYTTDYGVAPLKDMVNWLIWTKQTLGGTTYGSCWRNSASEATEAASQAAAGNYTTALKGNNYYWHGTLELFHGATWPAYVSFVSKTFTLNSFSTTNRPWKSVDLYAKSAPVPTWPPYATVSVWDTFGEQIGSNVFLMARSSAETNALSVTLDPFPAASTNAPTPWAAEGSYRGFDTDNMQTLFLVKWDGANGFQYK